MLSVKQYLESVDLGHHYCVFEESEIGLEEFLELTKEDLKELFPDKLGVQLRIFKLIQDLNSSHKGSDANDKKNGSEKDAIDQELKKTKRNALIKRGLIVGGVGMGTAAAAVVAAPFVMAGAGLGAAGIAAAHLTAAIGASAGVAAAGTAHALTKHSDEEDLTTTN